MIIPRWEYFTYPWSNRRRVTKHIKQLSNNTYLKDIPINEKEYLLQFIKKRSNQKLHFFISTLDSELSQNLFADLLRKYKNLALPGEKPDISHFTKFLESVLETYTRHPYSFFDHSGEIVAQMSNIYSRYITLNEKQNISKNKFTLQQNIFTIFLQNDFNEQDGIYILKHLKDNCIFTLDPHLWLKDYKNEFHEELLNKARKYYFFNNNFNFIYFNLVTYSNTLKTFDSLVYYFDEFIESSYNIDEMLMILNCTDESVKNLPTSLILLFEFKGVSNGNL